MFKFKLISVLVFALLALTFVGAVPPSRFGKKFDDKKLDEEWADDEDDEWHEDTFEWKRKMAQKNAPGIDMDTIQNAGGKMQDMVLEHEAKSGNMQMAFCTLKKGTAKTKFDAEQIGARWTSLMQTAGIRATLYAISEDDLLFTDDTGVIMQVRDFLLEQPEVEKFRWKDTDFDHSWLAKKKAEEAKATEEEKARIAAANKKATKKGGKPKARKASEEKEKKKKTKKVKKAKAAAESEALKEEPRVAKPAAGPVPPKRDL